MANKQLSYDFQNKKRDLSDVINTVLQDNPVFTSLVNMDGVATNTKHEWLEDVVTPKSWTLDAAYTAADGAMTLVSTAGIKAGDILSFTEATGASTTLIAKVDSVDSVTAISISVYGGSTDQNIADAATVKLVSRPKGEGTEAEADNGYEPGTNYNYTQIFDRTAKVSKTAESVKMYGLDQALDYQVQRQLQDLQYEIVNTIIFGRRVERGTGENGSMGGILHLMEIASAAGSNNTVDAGGSALDATQLNDAIEQGTANGATNMSVILCHPTQGRKISALNNDKVQVGRQETKTGSYVMNFVSDMPVAGGLVSSIVVDRNFPQDKVALLDTDKLNWIPLQNRGFSDADATPNGADYFSRRILGEYTLEMKNSGESHMLIENLAL